jgi:hypothetical protein
MPEGRAGAASRLAETSSVAASWSTRRGIDIRFRAGLRRLSMASFRTSVPTAWSPETAFDFMADLRNFAIWDPGVSSVRLVEGDGPGLGATFDVDVHAGPRTITLRYVTTEFVRPDRIVVVASTSTLISDDTIVVEPTPHGATVTYDAELSLRGVLRVANPLLAIAFGRIGERAADGLRRTLADTSLPAS